jgi:hypothetical protein
MIASITTKTQWDLFLKQVDSYDFYHTYDYHELCAKPDEHPILITYTSKDTLIGLPFLLRDIPDTSFKDMTSVYGYVGPILKTLDKNFDHLLFAKDFNTYLKDQNIISVFSRLNPFVDNQFDILQSIGEIKRVGQVVNINLNSSLEIQRQNYQRRIKTQINKARRFCKVSNASTKEEMSEFIKIYYENMDRVQANNSYYFDTDYFFRFLDSDTLDTSLLLVKLIDTNEIIAGAMFIKTNNIVQYHLSGSKEGYLDIAPVKLLIDEMRIRATEEGGYNYFNLGGGYGSQNDSLLRFKLSFSKQVHKFCIWKHIVDTEIYNELSYNSEETEKDYFPRYRSSN